MQSFTGVVTTGIYCRPGCPATPLRAQHAPVRARRRGRSRRLPPVPAVPARPRARARVGSPRPSSCAGRCAASPTARSTAPPKTTWPTRLGVSARHLRRLFAEHVGATPSDVARSAAGRTSRGACSTTPTSRWCSSRTAAGFNSVRQMNRVMNDVFRFTPTELRARRRAPDRLVVDGGLELRVPYRRAARVGRAALRSSRRARSPGVESVDVDAGIYRRTVEIDGAPSVIEVWNVAGRAGAAPAGAPLRPRRSRAPRRRRPPALRPRRRSRSRSTATLARDARLRPLVRARQGLRVPGAVDPFELGVRAILGQQVSVAGATALSGALVEAFGQPVPGSARSASPTCSRARRRSPTPISGRSASRRADPRPAGVRGSDRDRIDRTRPRRRSRRRRRRAVRAAGRRAVDRALHRDARLRGTRCVPRLGSRDPA